MISSMQFRMKNSRPVTTTGTRVLENSQTGSRMMKPIMKMPTDFEMTQEEIRSLKIQLNQTKKDALQAKSKVVYLEKELQRYENLIDEQSKNNLSADGSKIEKTALIQKLRNKHKQLVQELLDKNKEITSLKKGTKYTSLQELEIEVQQYGDENLRLRQQLEYLQSFIYLQNSGQSLEKKIIQQEKTIGILHKDNQDLFKQIEILEDFQKKSKQKIDELIKENEHYKITIDDLQLSNDQLISSNAQLKQILETQQQISQQPNDDLRQEFREQIEFLKNKNSEDLETKNKEIRELTTEIYKQTMHISELEKLLEQQEQTINNKSQTQSPNINNNIPSFASSPQTNTKQFALEMKPSFARRRLPKVQFYQIRILSMKVRVNLFKNKISYEQLDDYFQFGDELSIFQVREILKKYPFDIIDKADSTLLSRYLIEDNSEDYVIYDETKSIEATIIKSVFKKVVGKYQLFSEDEENHIIQEIKRKLNPNLGETIQMIISKKKNLEIGTCEANDFDQALKFHEISFTPREQEKFTLIVFELSQSLDIISYIKVIDYFK